MAAKPQGSPEGKKRRVGETTGGESSLEREVAALNYEAAMEQLEAIIDRVEHGEVGLEKTLEEYRRGRALLRRCQSILDLAEQDIKRLSLTEVETAARDADDEESDV